MKRYHLWLTGLAIGLLSGCGGSSTPVEPPEADLSEAYPEVSRFLQERLKEVRLKRSSADAWGQYAMALDAHEYHREAITCYEAAITLAPERRRWKYLLSLKLREQEPERAAELLMQVTRSERPPLTALIYHADLLAELQREDQLSEVLAVAEADFPRHPAVLYRRARRRFDAGDEKEALRILEAVGNNYKETTALAQRIVARQQSSVLPAPVQSDDLPGVDSGLEDQDLAAVASCRRDPLWRGRIAGEQAHRGDPLAIKTLKEIVDQYPALADNRLMLSLVLQEHGDSAQAREELLAGLELDPRNTRLAGELAAIEISESRWSEAETWLRRILSNSPESVNAFSDLAYVLERQGRKPEALQLLNQAIQRRPADPELLQRAAALENALEKASAPQ